MRSVVQHYSYENFHACKLKSITYCLTVKMHSELQQVEFVEPGVCHGFALWIDWVMDLENSIVISTGPGLIIFHIF